MSKYMLKRGQRAQSYVGFKYEGEGRSRIRRNIEVPMWQGKIVDTDVDLDHWVASGVMIKISEVVRTVDEPVVSSPSLPPPPVPTVVSELQIPSPVSKQEVDDIAPDDTDTDSESDADYDVEADTLNVPEDDDVEVEYEELEDHSYKCLLCAKEGIEKVLKTEEGMLKHIESKH